MLRCIAALILVIGTVLPVGASVELAPAGKPSVLLEEVYMRDGVPFLAIDEVLPALGLRGYWKSVEHVYAIRTPSGKAIISPGSQYLRIGGRFMPISYPPRFIDGRLRVSEEFVAVTLPELMGRSIYYRNLNPSEESFSAEENPLDRLFSFLLQQKKPKKGLALRAVAIDPGHGGQDHGCLAGGGEKEKDIALVLSQRLEKLLKMHLGIPVYSSRDADYALSMEKRLEVAAKPGVDALLLFHAQSSFDSRTRGINLFIRPREESAGGEVSIQGGESLRLAEKIRAALVAAGFKVSSVVQAPLLPLGRGNLPTVLVELGYLTNTEDMDILQSSSGQDRLASALFDGLKSFSEK